MGTQDKFNILSRGEKNIFIIAKEIFSCHKMEQTTLNSELNILVIWLSTDVFLHSLL